MIKQLKIKLRNWLQQKRASGGTEYTIGLEPIAERIEGSNPSLPTRLIEDQFLTGDCCATCLNCLGGGMNTMGCICNNPRMSMYHSDIQEARKKRDLNGKEN